MPQSPPDPVARRAVAEARADHEGGIVPVPLDEVLREFRSTLDTPNGHYHGRMTAKEKLRVRVEELTEREAEATLDFITSRGRDDFARWLDSRPEDDEPLTAEEREALAESDADLAAGRTISFEEIKREFGHPAG